MGYYVSTNLYIYGSGLTDEEEAIVKKVYYEEDPWIEEDSNYDYHYNRSSFYTHCKWCPEDTTLRKLSEAMPTRQIICVRDGEETDDVEVQGWYDGKLVDTFYFDLDNITRDIKLKLERAAKENAT